MTRGSLSDYVGGYTAVCISAFLQTPTVVQVHMQSLGFKGALLLELLAALTQLCPRRVPWPPPAMRRRWQGARNRAAAQLQERTLR